MSQRLHKRDLHEDPIQQFKIWFEEAKLQSGLPNPNTMILCTVSPEGWPEGRPVLLKDLDERGFVFFTNLESDKGRAIIVLPKAEMVFHWDTMGRQVRVRGDLSLVRDAEADAYFATRPRESQIAAWASRQSQSVESRAEMDRNFHSMEQKFLNKAVPRPSHWSGFRLAPNRVEFWKADIHRFHDRFKYNLEQGHWNLKRIYP